MTHQAVKALTDRWTTLTEAVRDSTIETAPLVDPPPPLIHPIASATSQITINIVTLRLSLSEYKRHTGLQHKIEMHEIPIRPYIAQKFRVGQ